jgi:ArsR family transcriptional regulator
MEIVDVLKALSDETRIRILNLLYQNKLCVCDLEEILSLSQSNASRHLSKLKNSTLISSEKQAQWVYFRMNDATLAQYPFLKEILEKELERCDVCRKDSKRLRQYLERGGSCSHKVILDEERMTNG